MLALRAYQAQLALLHITAVTPSAGDKQVHDAVAATACGIHAGASNSTIAQPHAHEVQQLLLAVHLCLSRPHNVSASKFVLHAV